MSKLTSIPQLFAHGGAIKALLTWPRFSITSYNMLAGLRSQGIIPATVIDVGANVGQFAIAASKLFPNAKVHAFEPQPDCFDELQRNCRSLDNVRVYDLALGERAGSVVFHVNTHRHSSSLLSLSAAHKSAFPDALESQDIEVTMTTLDDLMEARALAGPVLLKVDVQGYEPQVLAGATQTLARVDYVILEASFKPLYEGELPFLAVVEQMRTQGFDFLRPVGWLTDPTTTEVLQADALFRRRT